MVQRPVYALTRRRLGEVQGRAIRVVFDAFCRCGLVETLLAGCKTCDCAGDAAFGAGGVDVVCDDVFDGLDGAAVAKLGEIGFYVVVEVYFDDCGLSVSRLPERIINPVSAYPYTRFRSQDRVCPANSSPNQLGLPAAYSRQFQSD
jgi:hypothetical protein